MEREDAPRHGTAANTEAAPYAGASISDSLSGVLDDAVYNGDATATAGSLSYTSPSLTWTGSLAVGARVTITFSVTVSNPDTGDKVLVATITSPTSGSNCPAGTSSGQCTVTIAVIAGPLTITAPASADLASGPPGATIGSSLGTVQVTDDRGFGAGWTATVSSSDFTTGSGSPAETIPAGDATYTITSLATATGPATFTHATTVNLSGSPQAVVSATNVNGNTAITWDPVINVTVPAAAIGGAYTATITHSVS